MSIVRMLSRLFLAAFVVGCLCEPAARAGSLLDLVLVLDGSGSISASEFTLQKDAYARAFESVEIQDLISSTGGSGGIRLSVVVFSTSSATAIDWTHLATAADSLGFASAMRLINRTGIGTGTRIDVGLDRAWSLFNDLEEPGARRMVDVSGDGTSTASTTRASRDRLVALGVDQINGLAIGSQTIENFYRDNVIYGDESFVLRVDTFDQFEQAIHRKLQIEIGSVVPEPSSVVLAAVGLAVATAAGARARRRAASAA